MSDIPTKYYHKELYSTPLFLNRGVKAPFEPIGNDEGLLATSDPSLIFSLENARSQQIGGVRAITKEEYEAFKKKERPTSRSNRNFPSFRAAPPVLTGPVVSAYLPTPVQESPVAEAEKVTPSNGTHIQPKPIEPGRSAKIARKGKAPPL